MMFRQGSKLGGGFKYCLFPGEMIEFDKNIFQMGWFNHQLEKWSFFQTKVFTIGDPR